MTSQKKIVIQVYERDFDKVFDKVAVYFFQNGSIITRNGQAVKGRLLNSINIEAALTCIPEVGDRVKPITEVKSHDTRVFFASDESLRVLKALYDNDDSKTYLKSLVYPEPELTYSR